MENQIITGLLSYGMSGKTFHAPFLEASPKFRLHAVVERKDKNAQNDYSQVISYNSVDALLADDAIELVIVNTPNDTHFKFAEQALLAGKHVLIEKPFTPTVAEAKHLFDLASKMNLKVLPYQNRRFDSDFLSLKYIVDKNFVGRPIELHLRFDRYRSEIGKKAFKETRRPGAGILYDLGSHLLDQVISLFGKPKSATTIRGAYRENTKVDDYGVIQLLYSSGLNAFITTTMLAAHPQSAIVLHGTNGSFVKHRTDVQEAQLLSGVRPSDSEYGIENENSSGVLTIKASDNDGFETIIVPSEKGDYMELFDAVYNTICRLQPYPITQEDIITQLEILSPLKK